MDKQKLHNKLFFFSWIIFMCGTLIIIAYTFFLRNIKIDVTNQLAIEYDGENGVATVEVYYNGNDLNQRTQEFLESCTYQVEPNKDLSNGDVIKIITSYDESIASEYNFEPIHLEKEIKVEGLFNKYDKYLDIDEDYKDEIFSAEEKYVKNHVKSIYKELFPGTPAYTKVDRKVVYKAFLDSKQSNMRDRLVEIIRLDYVVETEVIPEEIEEGEVLEDQQESQENTESIENEEKEIKEDTEESEDLKEKGSTIIREVKTVYYLVTLSGINDGNEFDPQDIFGEKAYLSDTEITKQDYESYMNRVYKDKYEVQTIETVIFGPATQE